MCVWVRCLRLRFFFFFLFPRVLGQILLLRLLFMHCAWTVAAKFDLSNDFQPINAHCALFTDPQISLFNNFFIKNGSHSTIYTFKNYFATVFFSFQFQFSVFNFQLYPNGPYNLKLKSKPSKLKTLRNPRLLPLDLLPFCFSHVGSPSHLLTVESSCTFCFSRVPSPSPLSNVSLSIFFNSLLTVYKYRQQLNASIQVSLNPNLFSALFFLLDCLMFFIPFLNFVTTYCLLSVVMWLRLVHVVYAK